MEVGRSCRRSTSRSRRAFVLFVVSEAMKVTVANVGWEEGDGGNAFGRGLGDSATFRAVVVSAPMLGNLAGSVYGGVVIEQEGD